jgi:hypothetical protein
MVPMGILAKGFRSPENECTVAVSPLSSKRIQFAPPTQVSACESNSVLFVDPDQRVFILKHLSLFTTTLKTILLSGDSDLHCFLACGPASHRQVS